MSGGRLPKRIMFGNLDAVRRGRGGKEKEWTDCVQSDKYVTPKFQSYVTPKSRSYLTSMVRGTQFFPLASYRLV